MSYEGNSNKFLHNFHVTFIQKSQNWARGAYDPYAELTELENNGVITSEKRKWIENVLSYFKPIDPEAMVLLVEWEKLGWEDRTKLWRHLSVDFGQLKLTWIRALNLDYDRYKEKMPPPSFASEYLAETTIEVGLVEPVVVRLGDVAEYGMKIGRKYFYEKDLKAYSMAMCQSLLPHYSTSQVYVSLLEALKARAMPIHVKAINPARYLNFSNVVVDLETFNVVNANCLFTYELPEIDVKVVSSIANGKLDESYFAGYMFYKIIRKHYSDAEWLKLKRVLGAIIAPIPMQLITIVKGDTNTRKTFLFRMLKKALGKLVATVRLRQIVENRFSLQHALSAKVLVTSEEAQTIVENVDMLKAITGGDPLLIDRKFLPIIEKAESEMSILIFSNDLPNFKSWDEAFIGRLVIIETENPMIPTPEERDMMKMAEEEEVPKFIEFLLFCYADLKRSGWKIPEKGSERYIDVLVIAQSNTYEFAQELKEGVDLRSGRVKALFDKSARTFGSDLYELYLEWCSQKGVEALGRNTFYSHLQIALKNDGVVKTTINEKVVYKGIYLMKEKREPEDLTSYIKQ